jgi:hypothetical protein
MPSTLHREFTTAVHNAQYSEETNTAAYLALNCGLVAAELAGFLADRQDKSFPVPALH